MARPREFNTELVIDKATNLFWKNGFKGTSIQALVDYLALKRGSIYAAFGSKKGLFYLCLSRYLDEQEAKEEQILSRQLPAIEKIYFLLRAAVEDAKYDWERKGCFAVNTTLEALDEKDVKALLEKRNQALAETFRKLLTIGKEEGDIPSKLDEERTAIVILNNLLGIRVMSRTSFNDQPMAFVAEGLKDLLIIKK